MKNPVWAYGGGLLALVGATVLMGMNISAALGGDPEVWPTIWRVAGAILGDVAAACLPFAVLRAHTNGSLLMAAFLTFIWAGGCAYTVYSATEWNISQAAAVRDPIARAQWKDATTRGTYEQQIKLTLAKLFAANTAAIEGRTQAIRSDAMTTAKSAQDELARLNANPPAPGEKPSGTVRQPFSDWPWFWPVMLLVFSQAGWAVLAVAKNEAGTPAGHPAAQRAHDEASVLPASNDGQAGAAADACHGSPQRNRRFAAEIIPFKPRDAAPPAAPLPGGAASTGTLAEQVLLLASNGRSQVAIANELGIARSTVQRYLKKAEKQS